MQEQLQACRLCWKYGRAEQEAASSQACWPKFLLISCLRSLEVAGAKSLEAAGAKSLEVAGAKSLEVAGAKNMI